MLFGALWHRFTRTNRRRELEAEVARQRAEIDRQRNEMDRLRPENRALLNSILGIAGIPPIKFPAQSHSESSTRPLADDDSTFRPPPPANHAGQKGLPGPRQGEPGRTEPLGNSLPAWQGTRPRNDSLHSPAAAPASSVGARRPGRPGRPPLTLADEPGGSVVPGKNSWRDDHYSAGRTVDEGVVGAQHAVPGDDTWRDAAHSASLSGANTQSKPAGETLPLQKVRPVAPPHRRRSWHQINRILEIESARNQMAGD